MAMFLRGASGEADAVLRALGATQAVIHFDLDGTILTANGLFLEATGYALDEIKGRHHRMFVDPVEAASADYERFWAALRRGEHQQAEYRRFGKGGREIWIQATYAPIAGRDGRPFKVVKFATDVTEQKRRTAEAEGQVAAIGRSQAVIHFALDGTIQDANENFLAAMGYALEEIVGRHHGMFVDPDYARSADYAEFWASLRRGEFKSAEFRRFAKGGREIWIQATYNPIFDAAGRPFKVVKYATDVTAQVRKRLETDRLGVRINADLEEVSAALAASARRAAGAVEASSETAQTVQAVAAAAEELSASVREIQVSMDRSKASVDAANAQMDAASAFTQRLSETADQMNGIVGLITNIASQINLLALNATIESARAGEAGRGFAVVASEVKSLSNQVASATQSIAKEIEGMQATSSQVVEGLAAIRGAMAEVIEGFSSVAGSVEQQTAVTSEISGNMQAASDAVRSIDDSVAEIAQAISQVDGSTRLVRDNVRALVA